MKYLCLVYLEEQKLHAVPDSECVACGAGFRKSGLLIAAEALQPVETATTVRVRNGKMSVSDGPFAETKEQLAGFYLIEARDLNERSRWASKIPRRARELEVRPVRELNRSSVVLRGGVNFKKSPSSLRPGRRSSRLCRDQA